jgi:2-polyprenyl-3-methyl-5-hydroxy-6-metoxy-1,4-benzoquinol methylase
MNLVRAIHHAIVPPTLPKAVVRYYERLIDGVQEMYLRPICEEVLQVFPGAMRILDVGTGTGQFPIMLASARDSYDVTGVDLSDAYLSVARAKAEQAGVSGRVRFERISITEAQWHTEPFDLIISTCSLHHWRRPTRILAAAARLLNSDGQIWIIDDAAEATREARRYWADRVEEACHAGWLFRVTFMFESRFLAYSRPELEKMCERAGLTLEEYSVREVLFLARTRPASTKVL